MAGFVYIDQERCTLCGVCVSLCRRSIIAIEAGKQCAAVTDMSRCLGCGSCAKACPEAAITVERA